jgi:hypothetical protein
MGRQRLCLGLARDIGARRSGGLPPSPAYRAGAARPRSFASATRVQERELRRAGHRLDVGGDLTFTCVFTIPLYFQLSRSVTAAGSGIYVVPYMLASATGNIIGSRWGRRSGTMRGVLRIASLLGCAGLALLATLPLTVPAWAIIIAMILAGSGIGMCLIGSITSAQNALSAQDTGAGTGALLVLRSVGGASGSTLAGTIIASGLIAFRHAADSTASLTANSLHHGAAGLANLADGGLAGAQLGSSFATVYAAAAALATAAFLTTLWMPNTPLRESLHAVPIPE